MSRLRLTLHVDPLISPSSLIIALISHHTCSSGVAFSRGQEWIPAPASSLGPQEPRPSKELLPKQTLDRSAGLTQWCFDPKGEIQNPTLTLQFFQWNFFSSCAKQLSQICASVGVQWRYGGATQPNSRGGGATTSPSLPPPHGCLSWLYPSLLKKGFFHMSAFLSPCPVTQKHPPPLRPAPPCSGGSTPLAPSAGSTSLAPPRPLHPAWVAPPSPPCTLLRWLHPAGSSPLTSPRPGRLHPPAPPCHLPAPRLWLHPNRQV